MGIGGQAAGGRRHLDEIEQLARATGRAAMIERAVLHQRLDDLLADRIDGIERGHRLLEHHGDDATAQALARGLVEAVHVAALQQHFAADARAHGRVQTENRAQGDALTRARFAEEGEHLAGVEREGHVVHRAHDAVARREGDAEIADAQE